MNTNMKERFYITAADQRRKKTLPKQGFLER